MLTVLIGEPMIEDLPVPERNNTLPSLITALPYSTLWVAVCVKRNIGIKIMSPLAPSVNSSRNFIIAN